MRLAIFRLAHELRRPVDEIEQMSEEEFLEWLAYFRWLSEQEAGDGTA